jgi:hypothetical protein
MSSPNAERQEGHEAPARSWLAQSRVSRLLLVAGLACFVALFFISFTLNAKLSIANSASFWLFAAAVTLILASPLLDVKAADATKPLRLWVRRALLAGNTGFVSAALYFWVSRNTLSFGDFTGFWLVAAGLACAIGDTLLGEGYRTKSDFRVWIGFLAAAVAFSTLYTIVHLAR